jgi:hypothetical protein
MGTGPVVEEEASRMSEYDTDIDALTQALDTPSESVERQALRVKWANHLGHDGTIHTTITTECMFGSVLRDDVCHPRITQPILPEVIEP